MASIQAGQRVYRKNGALLGQFLRDIVSGQPISIDDFVYWDGSRPQEHKPIDPEILDFAHDALSKDKT